MARAAWRMLRRRRQKRDNSGSTRDAHHHAHAHRDSQVLVVSWCGSGVARTCDGEAPLP